MSSARFALVTTLAVAFGVGVGCDDGDTPRKIGPRSLGADRLPKPTAAPAQTAAEPTDDPNTPSAGGVLVPPAHVGIETHPQTPFTYTVAPARADGGQQKEDPDQAVQNAARIAAGACFTGISDGTSVRTATIRVVVLPSGSVSRTDVSAPTTQEPWILSCLEGVGGGLHFSDKPKADIRNFTISVTATRAH